MSRTAVRAIILGSLVLRWVTSGIDNSRNYMHYDGETIFHREERINGTRYIVFFSPRPRSRRVESFYVQFNEKETNLKNLMQKKFESMADMIRTVEQSLNGFKGLVDVKYGRESLPSFIPLSTRQYSAERIGWVIPYSSQTQDFLLKMFSRYIRRRIKWRKRSLI